MQASVTVQAIDVPPKIAITSPMDGSVFAAPADLQLSATASDTDGTVTNVQFFRGTTSLGNISSAPYSEAVKNLAAGDYAFSAIASDNAGAKTTNAITIHAVNPVPISLAKVERISPTGFQLSYSANAGLSYFVQRSYDLTHWTALSTNTAGSGTQIYLDPNATSSPAFYRVELVPNP
jgi:chitinase